MLAHTNTTRNVSVRACARVRACVTERWRERERRALTLKIVPSSSFFFCTSHRERGHFFLLWFPLSNVKKHSKKFSFFLPFFVSFLFFCLFYFLISPIKKIIPREEGRIFFRRRPLFFFFVCVFSCLSQQQHKKGIAKYLCAKAKKATLFFLGFAQKARKRSALKKNESNVTCSSLSFFFE